MEHSGQPVTHPPATRPRGTHHFGITVSELDRSAAFWGQLLGTTPTPTEHLRGPGLGRLVGYPSVSIDRCWVPLAGGLALELLQYLDRDEVAYDPGTAHPGNVHLCLEVDDLEPVHAHALACGASPVGDGWIEVPAGPNAGARIAYLRTPDGVTLELFQPPARANTRS